MHEENAPIGIALTRTGRTVAAAFDEALASAGGTLATWQVLMTVARSNGAMQREIAQTIGIEGATLTHHLNRMETAGLLTRERDPNNRRTHRVQLTDAGTELFHTLLSRVIAFDAKLRTGLGSDDEATLRSLLARLLDNCAQPDARDGDDSNDVGEVGSCPPD
jgi:MarR family transcriptional regulator, transcriptional regulator for hemolysin